MNYKRYNIYIYTKSGDKKRTTISLNTDFMREYRFTYKMTDKEILEMIQGWIYDHKDNDVARLDNNISQRLNNTLAIRVIRNLRNRTWELEREIKGWGDNS